MNKLIITCIAVLTITASSVFAGAEYSKDGRHFNSVTSTEKYRAGETQVDLFGDYSNIPDKNSRYLHKGHAYGASVAVSHFFTRNLGASIDGAYIGSDNKAGQVTGNFVARYPIGQSAFAPYGFTGAGVMFGKNNETEGVLRAGAGLEYRFTPQVGIKADYSWNVVNGRDNNFGMTRIGVGYNF